MDKMFYDVTVGIVSGLLIAFLTLVAKWQWPLIESLFSKEIRRQAEAFEGTWNAIEVFSGSKTKDTFLMEIKCKGRRVTGTHTGLTGPDQGKTFDIEGTFKDLILTFLWTKRGPQALESGTVTAKLVRERQLEGHGLYIEPSDGKVYTSTFTATFKG